jgi:predicted nucleic acid-binding protein
LGLISDTPALIARSDALRSVRTLAYRNKSDLPYDASALKADAPVALDTTVYLDALAGQLPSKIGVLVSSASIVHVAPAVAELALPIGLLDPSDPRTAASLAPIHQALARIALEQIVAPASEHWLEASLIAGTLARTQTIPKPDRRKFMNDILIYLVAGDLGATVLTRNTRDFDLLLQIRPGVGVLFYDRA